MFWPISNSYTPHLETNQLLILTKTRDSWYIVTITNSKHILPPSSLCTVFDSISSYIDEVLWINPSANVFVFGDFNVHDKDWLAYSGGTDRPGELC